VRATAAIRIIGVKLVVFIGAPSTVARLLYRESIIPAELVGNKDHFSRR